MLRHMQPSVVLFYDRMVTNCLLNFHSKKILEHAMLFYYSRRQRICQEKTFSGKSQLLSIFTWKLFFWKQSYFVSLCFQHLIKYVYFIGIAEGMLGEFPGQSCAPVRIIQQIFAAFKNSFR